VPHYLGNPIGTYGMIQLPDVDPGWSNPIGRNPQAKTLIGGGTATVRALNPRRAYPDLTWSLSNMTEAATLLGFQTGAWGPGPYALLDPAWDNLLDLDTSLMGSRRGVLTGWATAAGTVAYDPTITPFTIPSGVLRWSGAGNGTGMCAGVISGGFTEAIAATATPYVGTEIYTASVWGKTASGTALCKVGVGGRTSPVSVHTNVSGSNVTLNSTTWQQMTVATTAGFAAGADFSILTLTCGTAAAPDILLSCPLLKIGALTTWVFGLGCPRVSITAASPTTTPLIGWRDVSLQLTEI
jgi:hypothetical protein